MALDAFSPPGNLTDLSPTGATAWSADVAKVFAELTSDDHPQFFSPLQVDLASDATEKAMRWGAFPRKLAREPAPLRWQLAERRDLQEEYCEWSAIRDRNGRILKAFFTTEVPTYYHRLNNDDEDELLTIYRQHVDPRASLSVLQTSGGSYIADNPLNRLGAMHMIQTFNTFNAAVTLVAQASVVRTDPGGQLVTNANDLIKCGINADADRNSDPLIVNDVNALARTGAHVTLTDPIGLYIDRLLTSGWVAPDGSDPRSFWTITRGDSAHAVRAVYEVPTEAGFTVSDIAINGVPITSPSQIAEHVLVRVSGTAHLIGTQPAAQRSCGARGNADEGLEALAVGGPPSMAALLEQSATGRG